MSFLGLKLMNSLERPSMSKNMLSAIEELEHEKQTTGGLTQEQYDHLIWLRREALLHAESLLEKTRTFCILSPDDVSAIEWTHQRDIFLGKERL